MRVHMVGPRFMHVGESGGAVAAVAGLPVGSMLCQFQWWSCMVLACLSGATTAGTAVSGRGKRGHGAGQGSCCTHLLAFSCSTLARLSPTCRWPALRRHSSHHFSRAAWTLVRPAGGAWALAAAASCTMHTWSTRPAAHGRRRGMGRSWLHQHINMKLLVQQGALQLCQGQDPRSTLIFVVVYAALN